MTKVVSIFFIWLVTVNLFGLLVLNRFNLEPDTAYSWIDGERFFQTHSDDLLTLHNHWDSEWYLDIAQNGYSYRGEGELSNLVFLPLYPLLIKIISFFTLGNSVVAGILVSTVALLIACIYLYKLTRQFFPNIDSVQPIIYLLIFPTAFFLNSVYSEALYLALSVIAFYYMLNKKFVLAAVVAALAALTRFSGIALFIPLILIYLNETKKSGKSLLQLSSLLLIPLATGSFLMMHYLLFGDLFLFFKVEEWWGRGFNFNSGHFLLTNPAATSNFILDVGFLLFGLIGGVLAWNKLGMSYGIYVLISILIPLSTGTLSSINRYILPLFPLFLVLASFKNERFKFGWNLLTVLLLGLYISLFVNNYWAG